MRSVRIRIGQCFVTIPGEVSSPSYQVLQACSGSCSSTGCNRLFLRRAAGGGTAIRFCRMLRRVSGKARARPEPGPACQDCGYLAANSACAPALRAAALSVASQVKPSPERPKWP